MTKCKFVTESWQVIFLSESTAGVGDIDWPYGAFVLGLEEVVWIIVDTKALTLSWI